MVRHQGQAGHVPPGKGMAPVEAERKKQGIMGESVKKEFWYVMVEGIIDENHGGIANFYGYGTHLGEVIGHVLSAAEETGFASPHAVETGFVESDYEMPDDLETLNDHVQWSPSRYLFPVLDYGSMMVLPTGIVHAAGDPENDPDLIREAFYTYGHEKNSQNEYGLDLVVSRLRLRDTFFSFIRFLSDINGLFFRVAGFEDDENAPYEIWAFYDSDPETLINILAGNTTDTLENGYVEIAVTASEGETRSTLILDSHKHISFFSRDERIFAEAIRLAETLGFEETGDLYHVEAGYYHWHYRPAASRRRRDFFQWLDENDFDRVE
ncbi:hypothetical protein LJC19_00215 [Oxalobacter sp. OttesenSCG-928-P03]|nr:hypothetical protein [Oxalobacter sp. OttesenSCG-928-P03]